MLSSSSRNALKINPTFSAFACTRRAGPALCVQRQYTNNQAQAANATKFYGNAPNYPPSRTLDNRFSRHQQQRHDMTLARMNNELAEMVERKRGEDVFKVARKMKEAGLRPNAATYDALLQACRDLQAVAEAWAIFEDMIACKVAPTRGMFLHLIHATRRAPVHNMNKALDLMRSYGLQPDHMTYEAVISRLVIAENLELALQYLAQMGEEGKVPTVRTLDEVVKLACTLHCPKVAVDLALAYESRDGWVLRPQTWQEILMGSADILYMDGVLIAWKKVVHDLGLKLDEGCLVVVLHTAARHGLSTLAEESLAMLHSLGIPWQEHHFAAVIEAFLKGGNLKEAFETLTILREFNVETTPTFVKPIWDHLNLTLDPEHLDRAWAVLEDLATEGKTVDIMAYNAVVQACVQARDLGRAIGCFEAAGTMRLKPDLETYHLLLEGCIQAKHRDLGDKIMAELREVYPEPNVMTYELLVKLCLTEPTYEDAFFYLEEAKAAGLKPTVRTYDAIVRKCLSVGDERYKLAYAELQEMGYVSVFAERLIKNAEAIAARNQAFSAAGQARDQQESSPDSARIE